MRLASGDCSISAQDAAIPRRPREVTAHGVEQSERTVRMVFGSHRFVGRGSQIGRERALNTGAFASGVADAGSQAVAAPLSEICNRTR